jgi:hypothetical protein
MPRVKRRSRMQRSRNSARSRRSYPRRHKSISRRTSRSTRFYTSTSTNVKKEHDDEVRILRVTRKPADTSKSVAVQGYARPMPDGTVKIVKGYARKHGSRGEQDCLPKRKSKAERQKEREAARQDPELMPLNPCSDMETLVPGYYRYTSTGERYAVRGYCRSKCEPISTPTQIPTTLSTTTATTTAAGVKFEPVKREMPKLEPTPPPLNPLTALLSRYYR